MKVLSGPFFAAAKVALVFVYSMPSFSSPVSNGSDGADVARQEHAESIEIGRKVEVVVRVYVDVGGRHLQTEVSQTSGYPMLDKEALDRVSHWKFSPAGGGRFAKPMWHVVPITFTLKH